MNHDINHLDNDEILRYQCDRMGWPPVNQGIDRNLIPNSTQ